MAGFGGGATEKGKKGKKSGGTALKSLKPKSQWDRYLSLKTATSFKVGVRKVDGDEWLDVGYARSDSNEFTEIAIARQRAIIAEHARRVHPLQVSPKDMLEWGYYDESESVYVSVSKDVCDNLPNGIEKKIGFEGFPDVKTGFYCHYDKGRIVEKKDEQSFIQENYKGI